LQDLLTFRWFYEVFVDIFNGKLKDVFSSALRTEVTHAIAGINDECAISFDLFLPGSYLIHPPMKVFVTISNQNGDQ